MTRTSSGMSASSAIRICSTHVPLADSCFELRTSCFLLLLGRLLSRRFSRALALGHLRALRSRFGETDGNRLLPALYLASGAALQRPLLAAAHRARHPFASSLAVLRHMSSHVASRIANSERRMPMLTSCRSASIRGYLAYTTRPSPRPLET